MKLDTEDEGTTVLQNIGNYLPHDKALQTRGPVSLEVLQSEPACFTLNIYMDKLK
jgi:hypothetical protein